MPLHTSQEQKTPQLASCSNLCVCDTQLLQLCLTPCDPMDRSPPGSSVHGILQARILEWVAMPSCRGSSPPKDRTCVSGSRHHLSHQGNPWPNPPPVNSEVRNDSPHFLGISCKGVEYFAHCPSANKSYVDELGGAKRYE